ncbi:hypothetical protein, partial [Ruminiclostridium cellobioparum]|uniref:hypothetical protein n=1 Tax=Ruminiclostridium cellobioparum TaxID=29355 RepID=UPI0028B0B3B9
TPMIKNMDQKFEKYGLIHYQQTQNILSLAYAQEQKDALKAEIRNINISTLNQIVADLKAIKEEYIKESIPLATTDPLELSFVEKELKVMTETELMEYYKENYLDTNIVRLLQIEYKARKGHKEGKVRVELPEYNIDDSVISRIDSDIKRTFGMRQITGTMCAFIEKVDEYGTPVPRLISWNTIFEQIENRNLIKHVEVLLTDLF